MVFDFIIYTDASVCPRSGAVGAFLILSKEEYQAIITREQNFSEEIKAKIQTTVLPHCKSSAAEFHIFLHAFNELFLRLSKHRFKINFFSDSQTLCQLVLQRRQKLEAANFCNKQGELLRHASLYKEVFRLCDQHDVRITKIKGHKSKKDMNSKDDVIFSLIDMAARQYMRKRSNT